MPFKDKEEQRKYAREYQRAKRLKDPSAARAAELKWRLKNREKLNAKARRYWAKNHDKALATLRKSALKRRYGITPEQREEMSAAQLHLCAICGGEKKLFVDHDHDTGVVRALLCRLCNSAIGMLRENPAILELAAAYLRKHGR